MVIAYRPFGTSRSWNAAFAFFIAFYLAISTHVFSEANTVLTNSSPETIKSWLTTFLALILEMIAAKSRVHT